MKRMIKRYSEAFKKQVVSEYEGGHSIQELRRKYGIKGNGTVERWVKKYGNAGLRHELVIIQRAEERQREKEMATRIKELETAVAQLALEKIVLESSLAEAEKMLGVEVKKKVVQPSLRLAMGTL